MTAFSADALWIGGSDDAELSLARSWARDALRMRGGAVHDFASPHDAAMAAALQPATPRVAFLATDKPARWTLTDAVTLSRGWPLMPIVSVAASLVDGRRRSGPPLPGIEEVAWHDLPGRLDRWLEDWDAARPGTLGMPATVRRDERLLAVVRGGPWAEPPAVSIVAATPLDAEGVTDAVAAAGGMVVGTRCGRPGLDEPAPILVWDIGRLSADHLGWLRILAANRPGLAIVLLESFPRADRVQAALDAGAAAVLGRPLSLEAFAGTLHRLHPGAGGLGRAAGGR